MTNLNEVTIVPEPSENYLNQRQELDYRSHRKQCLEWLLAIGKEPEKAQGYALATVKGRAYRMDQFYRWVWDTRGGYTVNVSHDDADDWLYYLAKEDNSNAHNNNCRKALLMLYKWREYELGCEPWEPEISFARNSGTTTPRDYLTLEERSKVREAALEYGSVPEYDYLTPEDRSRWKAYLAQRFEKPKSEVSRADWDRANGWKIPSLVSAGLDAALRPIEVKRASVDWVDTENGVLRIPKEDSAKNEGNWIVSLQTRTAEMLNRWLKERSARSKYDETDALWLTREGNRFGSSSLKYILERCCDIADVSTDNRSLSWYSIRHSTGTYMTREEDLAAAQTQLRHKSPESTMKYDQTPVEDRKNALERM